MLISTCMILSSLSVVECKLFFTHEKHTINKVQIVLLIFLSPIFRIML